VILDTLLVSILADAVPKLHIEDLAKPNDLYVEQPESMICVADDVRKSEKANCDSRANQANAQYPFHETDLRGEWL
jgi:hypothetical protein